MTEIKVGQRWRRLIKNTPYRADELITVEEVVANKSGKGKNYIRYNNNRGLGENDFRETFEHYTEYRELIL